MYYWDISSLNVTFFLYKLYLDVCPKSQGLTRGGGGSHITGYISWFFLKEKEKKEHKLGKIINT
jgi:hypothetical protein